MCIGITGNIAVIVCNISMAKEQAATDYLIRNLALADLLTCLTFYPVWIVEFTKTILGVDSDQVLFCKLSRSSSWMLLFVSIATLFAITIDRYIFIVKPFKYPVIVTIPRVILVISGIWITGCGILALHVLKYTNYPRYRSLCFISYDIGWSTTILIGYIPLIFLFIINFKMLAVAKRQRKRIVAEKTIVSVPHVCEQLPKATKVHHILRAWKKMKTLFIVVAVLVICCLVPTVFGRALLYICSESCQQVWWVVINYELYGVNSIVNPFIYGLRHVKYRRSYQHNLFKLFPCV